MGCLTGFCLILKGNRPSRELYGLMPDAFRSVRGAKEVPGTAPASCGHFEYPAAGRPVTGGGQLFYDS